MEGDKIFMLEKKVAEMQKRLDYYEKDGSVRLFFALNRKLNEMADMLNKQSLITLDLADGKDKSFERMKIVWESAEKIATAVKVIGETAGVIQEDESKSEQSKFRKPITAESMADAVGELAGRKA